MTNEEVVIVPQINSIVIGYETHKDLIIREEMKLDELLWHQSSIIITAYLILHGNKILIFNLSLIREAHEKKRDAEICLRLQVLFYDSVRRTWMISWFNNTRGKCNLRRGG